MARIGYRCGHFLLGRASRAGGGRGEGSACLPGKSFCSVSPKKLFVVYFGQIINRSKLFWEMMHIPGPT